MEIGQSLIFDKGDKIICILASNSSLEIFKEYTVKECRRSYGDSEVMVEENASCYFNSNRFISIKHERDSTINFILNGKD